jgi:hypothetical protein
VLHAEPTPAQFSGMIEGTLRYFNHVWSREEKPPTLRQGMKRLETCFLPLPWLAWRPAVSRPRRSRSRRSCAMRGAPWRKPPRATRTTFPSPCP